MKNEFYGYCYLLDNGNKKYIKFFRTIAKANKYAKEVQEKFGENFKEGKDWKIDELYFE